MMRATWTLLGLMLGPLAVWLYRRSYHNVPWMRHGQMVMWQRQGFGPALAQITFPASSELNQPQTIILARPDQKRT